MFLTIMKSTKRISAPITPEDDPVMYQAFHTGIKVLRYFSDPISEEEADPFTQ